MVRHPCQLHASWRLDDDREKQIELPDQRSAGDVHLHPHSAGLPVGAAVEDLYVSDDVRAPVRVGIERR